MSFARRRDNRPITGKAIDSEIRLRVREYFLYQSLLRSTSLLDNPARLIRIQSRRCPICWTSVVHWTSIDSFVNQLPTSDGGLFQSGNRSVQGVSFDEPNEHESDIQDNLLCPEGSLPLHRGSIRPVVGDRDEQRTTFKKSGWSGCTGHGRWKWIRTIVVPRVSQYGKVSSGSCGH